MTPDPRITLAAGTSTTQHYIAAPFADLMTPNGIGTQALFGQRFDLISERAGVAQGALYAVLTDMDRVDYIGTLPTSVLSKGAFTPTCIVTAIAAPIFEKADIKSRLLGNLPRNSALQGEISGAFLKSPHSGYIHLRHLRKIGQASSRSFIDFAKDMLGLPYVWGGTGGVGVDCSGLVQSALAAAGVDAPRDADQQEAALGQAVQYEDRRQGDFLFWPGHVGIVIEDDQLLHANAYHMSVAIEAVSAAVARIGVVRTIKRL